MSDIEQKLERLKIVFEILVDGYILEDLKILMAIQPNESGYGGCTVPAALAIISAMDMLGTKLTSNPNESGAQYLPEFIRAYLTDVSETEISIIVQNYRHKMMHEFLPARKHFNEPNARFAISKTSASGRLIDTTNPLLTTLNIDVLYDKFLEGVTKLKKVIFIDKNESDINAFYSNIPDGQTTNYQAFHTASANYAIPESSASSSLNTTQTTILP
ncbi:MAG: hypothetical protein ABI921_00205 [Panacibacter sp.]